MTGVKPQVSLLNGSFKMQEDGFVKRVFLVIILFLAVIGMSPSSLQAGDPAKIVPKEVMRAGTNGLKLWWKAIPPQDIEKYGFERQTKFEDLSLGQPYCVMTINPQQLAAASNQQDIRSILTATNMWLFPVLQRGKPGALLTVDLMGKEWKAVGIGSAGIAGELDMMEHTWTDEEGFGKIFVRVFQATCDILLIVKGDSVNVVPFESARVALNLEKTREGVSDIYAVSEVIPMLARVVDNNLRRNKR